MFKFNKTRRLSEKKDYELVFNQAKKLTTPEFIVLYRENSLETSRLGFALSKKYISKAHDRNRLKRLIRENFRLQALPNVDIVFLAKKNAEKVKNDTVIFGLNMAWEKIIRYKN